MINFLTDQAVNTICGPGSGGEQIVALVGKIISIFQVAIPIILVVVGLIGLGKAVVAGKDDEVKKATGGLIKKVVLAAAIFFVVAIVRLVVGLVSNSTNDAMQTCWDVIADPWGYDASSLNSGGTSSSGSSNGSNQNP